MLHDAHRAPLPELIELLPRLFGIDDVEILRSIAARFERVTLERGDLLFRAGAAGHELYVVLSGRLVAIGADAAGGRWVSGAMTAGATVGEIALLTRGTRSADVVAVRRSELVRLSRSDFEAVSAAYPSLLMHVSSVLAERLARAEPVRRERGDERVITVVGLDHDADLHALSTRIATALGRVGTALRVDPEIVGAALGSAGVEQADRLDSLGRRVDAWLSDQEGRHRFVLLDAGSRDTPWRARCLDHADHVLLVARAGSSSALRPFEAALHRDGGPSSGAGLVSLALLHPVGTQLPSGTARWLDPRRLHGHHHLRDGRDADLQRMARLLAGVGVGVVLGGGGALGAAHIGVLEALEVRGVPIDAIGGTSSGGGIAAQVAMGLDQAALRRTNYETFVENNPFYRVTLPVLSVCDRGAVDRAAWTMFGDAQIEDLWIPYFCVSTDLTHGCLRVHRRGPVWLAVRATTSIPGILPPVIEDGAVLVDGGVLDNLPVGPMKQLCGGPVIAVDVTPSVDLIVDYTYEEMPGSLRALMSRVGLTSSRATLPTIPRVLMRTLTVSSQGERERSVAAAHLVLKPPVDGFNPMDFRAFHAIRQIGLRYAEATLAKVDVAALLDGTALDR